MSRAKKTESTFNINARYYFIGLMAILVTSASASSCYKTVSKPGNCLDTVPEAVEGLEIISGPRTKANIIRDMVYPICNGHALYRNMRHNGAGLVPGRVTFRVTVEYTGEVNAVEVVQSTIKSEHFIREVKDFIMDTDFVYWQRSDIDTVFVYPVDFGG